MSKSNKLLKFSIVFMITVVCAFAFGLVGCSSSTSSSNRTSSSTNVEDAVMEKVSVESLKNSVSDTNVVFLDVRKAEDYEAGHIIGAINADMDKAKDGDTETGITTMKKVISENNIEDEKLILVCYTGNKYAQAGFDVLKTIGYDMSKVVAMEGGMKAWTEAGLKTVVAVTDATMTKESVDSLKSSIGSDDVVVLDVRKSSDYQTSHIKGAINADMDKAKSGNTRSGLVNLQEALTSNNITDKKIVLVCYTGNKYAQAATNCLQALGYDMSKVVTLEGGMKAWTEGGNETVS